jgi:hypothetical protein
MNVNVTETTTGVQISENPAGLASGVLTGSYPNPALNYGAVDHVAMDRSSYRLFSDFGHNASPWNVNATNGATATYTHIYSGDTVNYITISPAINTAGSRGWISDRPDFSVQPQMVFGIGYAASNFSARVRVNKGAQTNITYRVGFSQGHAPPIIGQSGLVGDGQVNACCFLCYGSKTTWHALAAAKYVRDPSDPSFNTGDATEIDTGIAVNDWHVLEVRVNAAGTQALFYIDGALAATITTNIPTVATADPKSNGNWCMAGCSVRAGDPSGITALAPFDIDWQSFEYKRAR